MKKTATALDSSTDARVSFSPPLGSGSLEVCLRLLQLLRDNGLDFKEEEDPRRHGPLTWARLWGGPSGFSG